MDSIWEVFSASIFNTTGRLKSVHFLKKFFPLLYQTMSTILKTFRRRCVIWKWFLIR
ncbi:hypothetical protein CLOLEP_01677 [[Clostridium] leptum DSM 753]|uniref:Uncharacterized protein n=1 Tax=[Clostridium] leptum DSM 753 TaxID=428125 RepID=A7VSY6_9FIRM|nr:hypothetical protein CLOLEP_01677 [[Clostridium] leptum DSM 753]